MSLIANAPALFFGAFLGAFLGESLEFLSEFRGAFLGAFLGEFIRGLYEGAREGEAAPVFHIRCVGALALRLEGRHVGLRPRDLASSGPSR